MEGNVGIHRGSSPGFSNESYLTDP